MNIVSIWHNLSIFLFMLIVVTVAQSLHAEINGQVEAYGLSFISPDFDNNKKEFGFFGASLLSHNAEKDTFKINLRGEYAIGTPVLSTLNVRELYFSYFIDESSAIHVGRRKQLWSDVDERWNLGFFQPEFRANPLAPETQGQTGIFYENNKGDWKFTFYGSPVFIPDQGPNFEIKDGQFVASNPYFAPPPQNIYFQSVLLPIDYNIQKPEIADIVFQPSYGLQIHYGEKTGFYSLLSSMYKPAHQLAYGWKGVLVTDRVRVDVKPKTYYEKIYNWDIGYKDNWGDVGISALFVDAEKPDFESVYNRPVYASNLTLGPYITYKMNPFTFELAGLFNQDGDVAEEGPNSGQFKRSLSQMFLYRNAYYAQITYKSLLTPQIKYKTTFQWLEAEKNIYKSVKWKNLVDIKGPWKFIFDLLLVETNDEITNVSSYRNLDQAWLGVIYVF